MATDLGREQAAPGTKHDAFVAAQLGRAEGRLRFLDVAAGLLGFAAGTLVYAVLIALCDRWLGLPEAARKLLFSAYFLAALVYLYRTVFRPLRQRVNPYYAARQVEQTVPGAKNSVVNWVDLHTLPLPAAIRGAVSQRAAKDLAKADLEQAISGRGTGWMGALAALGAFAFVCVFLWLGPRQFSFFLGRAFNPFMGSASVPTRTQLTVLRPEGGNTTLTIGRALPIVVQVDGRIPDPRNPDALKLLYRYQESDPYQQRFLQEDAGREWSTVVSALDVHDGFWYKITGGDAETAEYRVNVRTTPLITHFQATYHFRPYVARSAELRHDRKLEALCGTEVLLAVQTNRSLKDARLDLDTKQGRRTLVAEHLATDPQAFQVRLTLAESGTYRLHFTSVEGETYADASTHEVIAIPDHPPQVELTLPGQDIRLPANGLLRVEGKASDDVGVKSLTLRMEIAGGQKLQGKAYRSEKDLTLPGGGNLREVLYKDFVDLAKVKNAEGAAVKLEPGMEMEYWLEASDACDYHRPHVAESKHFRVQIIEPQKNEKKQEQDRNAAQKEQQDHQAQQDKQREQENKQREQERKEQEARNQKEQGKNGEKGDGQQDSGDPKDGSPNPKTGQGKPGEQGGDGQGQQNPPAQGEGPQNQANPGPGQEKPQPGNPAGRAQQQPGAEARQKEQDLQKTAEKLKNLLDQQQQGKPQQGPGQGENQPGSTQPTPKPESDKGTQPMPQPGDKAPGSGQGGEPKTGPKEGPMPEPSGQGQDGSQPKPEDATPSTVAKLAKDLKSPDPRTRDQAARQLEKIKDQARDPQAKEDARKALEEANRKPQPAPGDKGPEQGPPEPMPMPAPGTGQPGDKTGTQPGTGSPGEKNKEDKEKGTNQGAKGTQADKGGQPDEGTPKPNGPEQPAGNTPGTGGTERGPGQGEPRPERPQPNKVKPSKPEDPRAMQMQLDDFKKRIDKNILRDAKMSEKDLQQFLKDWQDLIRKKQADAEKKEPLPDAQRTSPLRSTGSQRTGTAGSGTTDDVKSDGRPLPPPGYREARREFTRLLSEPDKDKKP